MAGIASFLEGRERLEALAASLRPGGPLPGLADLKIKLTASCNLRCRMCGYWRRRGEPSLDAGTWRRILSESKGLGCGKVHFSGGEVFTRDDALDLVEHAAGLGMKVNLTTNATLLDRDKARRLARAKANAVSVSLDAPTASKHDAIRGVPGSFKAALRGTRLLARMGSRPKVRINVVVMRGNFRELPAMVDLAGGLGAVDLVPMPVDEKGEPRNRLSKAQILEYNREIAPRVEERRAKWGFPASFERVYPFGVTESEVRHAKKGRYSRGLYETQPCLAPWLHLFLRWDGGAYPCCMTNGRIPALGNAAREGVAAAFHGPAYARLRASFLAGKALKDCRRCDLFLKENVALWGQALSFDFSPEPACLREKSKLKA